MVNEIHEKLEAGGVAVHARLLPADVVERLEASIKQVQTGPSSRRRRGELFGLRNVLREVPAIRELVTGSLFRELVIPVLGQRAAAVRGIFFDKTHAANWSVGWHQDRAIAVSEAVPVPGYGPWSVKAGVHHVCPPVDILEDMLAVRIHLDDADESNGALEYIPGSHTAGVLADTEIERYANAYGSGICEVMSGDAVLMRPLTIHRSCKCAKPRHRRVVHIEYDANPLPAPLEWNESYPFERR